MYVHERAFFVAAAAAAAVVVTKETGLMQSKGFF